MSAPGRVTAASGATGRATLVLLAVVVAGWLGLALAPTVQRRLGIFDRGMWFLDTYAILASNDAVRAGLDPFEPNPLDVYHRPHSYSGWWFALGRVGLTREDNFLLGATTLLFFLAAAVAVLRPRSLGEAGLGAALLLAPPVLLAVNRANNDLVVFAVLAAGVLAARGGRPVGLAVFAGAVALATGLKFYPLVAAGAFVVLAPAGRAWRWTAGAALVAALVFATVWGDFQRAVIPESSGTYLFGAGVIAQGAGWGARAVAVVAMAVLGSAGFALAARGWTAGLRTEREDLGERLAFAVGALVLLACFVAGVSFAYRWVFALLLVPWLWRRREERAALVALGLLVAAAWLDGLYCAALNTLVGPMPLDQLQRWATNWARLSQPVTWALLVLLAGWLAEAGMRLRRA